MISSNLHDLSVTTIDNGYRVHGWITVSEDETVLSHDITVNVTATDNVAVTGQGDGSVDCYFDFEVYNQILTITVTAENSRYPTPDKLVRVYNIDTLLYGSSAAVIHSGLYGPLPADNSGSALQKGYGIDLIKAAIELLLHTQRGERIMMPEYGNSLRKLIFSSAKDTELLTDLKKEIATVLSQYLPGVTLVGATIARAGKTATVNAVLTVDGTSVPISLEYMA